MLFRPILCSVVGLLVTTKYCSKEAETAAVQNSWTKIKDSLGEKGPETVGRLIFENLFKDFPYMVNFFKNYGDNAEEIMANQKFMWHARERVFGTLDKIISNLGDDSEIKNISSWIAKVHESKGVKPTDLLNLGTAVLKTLEQALGNDFTPDLKLQWTQVVTSLMKGIGSFIKI